MSNFLTAYLRVPVKVAVVSVSQVTYEEFIFSLPVPTLLTVFNMAPDMGNAILETNPQFVFTLIDLIFGGEGKSSPKVRELTEIELTVMQEVHGKLLDNLSYVWKGVTQLQPKIESMETNPSLARASLPARPWPKLPSPFRSRATKGLLISAFLLLPWSGCCPV